LLEGPEDLQIPDLAPPPVEGAKELEKGLRETFEPMLLRRIFYDEIGGRLHRTPVTRKFVREQK
jgi:hypothetical protein